MAKKRFKAEQIVLMLREAGIQLAKRRRAIDYMLDIFKNVSECKVCKAIEQPRSTQRYQLVVQDSDTRLADLFVFRGTPEYIRSDNDPEFVSKKIRSWLKASGVQTLYIESGSPCENGYIESFNGKLRDELLNREIFETLLEAKVFVERWKTEHNTVRPHSPLKLPISCSRGY